MVFSAATMLMFSATATLMVKVNFEVYLALQEYCILILEEVIAFWNYAKVPRNFNKRNRNTYI